MAELRGLDAKQVIAIGDTDSDVSMIRAAGAAGVCMANGAAGAKAAADYIAPSNNDCGVADANRRDLFSADRSLNPPQRGGLLLFGWTVKIAQ